MRRSADKIVSGPAMAAERKRLARQNCSVVFTNGCFDLLHTGHVSYLEFARAQGDVLVVGLNSDASVQANKGPERPIIPEAERARVLAALECVDYVVVFNEPEPIALIRTLLPDVLVKGKDWAHYVCGREVVESNGGRVVLAPLVEGRSTTHLIEQLRAGGPAQPEKELS